MSEDELSKFYMMLRIADTSVKTYIISKGGLMNTYNNLINNLEKLELLRFKKNIDTYLDMIADGKKQL